MSTINFRIAAAGLASLAVLSLACGSEDVITPTPGGPGTTPVGSGPGIISGYDSVYFSLRSAGGQVEKGDEPSGKEVLFSVKGRTMLVNGKDVLVYEYRSVSAAEDEAGRISPDGSEIRSADGRISHVDWVAAPHFYRQANTIVLYVGDDEAVLGVLGKALGEPFAGRARQSEPATESVPAPIDAMKVERSENVPLSYVVVVESGLPNSCVKFSDYKVDRQGNSFNVAVTNLVPTDPNIVCLQVYGTVQSIIPLTGPFEEGVTYSIDVNGKTATWVGGEAGSTPGKDDPAPGNSYKLVPAPIDDLQVAILESFPVQYRLLVKSGLPSSCAQFDSYEVNRGGDTVRVTVNNRVPTDQVACAMIYGTVEHSIAIGNGNDYVKGTTVTVFVNDKQTTFVAQ